MRELSLARTYQMRGKQMAKTKQCCKDKDPARLNKVGGQAVLEGVMMKAGEKTVTTCRKGDGTLVVTDNTFQSVRQKHKILNIPILRGVVNFVEMLILSFKTLSISADAMGLEEEEKLEKAKKLEKKNEKRRAQGKPELEAKEGESALVSIVMGFSMILGVLLSVVLFMLLPGLASDGIGWLCTRFGGFVLHATWKAVIEGVAKIIIFLTYLWLVSLLPDIKRTFMYHGAEHKSIACFESGDDLTPENAKNYTRFHPRCGTSFMFVMIILGIFAGIFVNNIFEGLPRLALTGIRLLILPVVMGLGYEFIMFAGKHDNFFTRAISAPGLWVQRLTTKKPTTDMLEVAIISIKCALRDDFPEFREFYDNREWEPKAESEECGAADTDAVENQSETDTASQINVEDSKNIEERAPNNDTESAPIDGQSTDATAEVAE